MPRKARIHPDGWGRSDLWFKLKKGDWQDGYNLEAKIIFPWVKNQDLSQKLRKSMKQAIKDLQGLDRSERPHHLLAAVFVVPKLREQELSKLAEAEKGKIVSDFFDDLQYQVENQELDFYAEYRPSSKKWGGSKEGWKCPGIALVGKVYR